jgi:hypothetical protein
MRSPGTNFVEPLLESRFGVLAYDGSPTGPLAGRINSVRPPAALRLRFRCSSTCVPPDPGDADERPFRGDRLGSNSAPPRTTMTARLAGLRADVLRYSVECESKYPMHARRA